MPKYYISKSKFYTTVVGRLGNVHHFCFFTTFNYLSTKHIMCTERPLSLIM